MICGQGIECDPFVTDGHYEDIRMDITREGTLGWTFWTMDIWTDILQILIEKKAIKITGDIYFIVLCFMLKSIINFVEIKRNLTGVVC